MHPNVYILSLRLLEDVLHICVCMCPRQPLTTMPECSQTPRRQRPDYLADFTSGSSAKNSCSSSDEEEQDKSRKAEKGRYGEKKEEKKVSYDLGESKEKNLVERSGRWKCWGSLFWVVWSLTKILFLIKGFLFFALCWFTFPRSIWTFVKFIEEYQNHLFEKNQWGWFRKLQMVQFFCVQEKLS